MHDGGTDVIKPNVATTMLSIQHGMYQQQQQQQPAWAAATAGRGRWHHQGGNQRRRNVYRTNSRRRCDLTPAVRRCVVTDKPDDVPQQQHQPQQPTTTLFSRRHVINLDPLSARPEQVRGAAGGGGGGRAGGALPAAAATVRWQRQQTSYQLTPRAMRTARTDASAGARLTTRRERTLTEENLLSATGKKLLDGASRNETCRVIELKLGNTQTTATAAAAAAGSETSRRQHMQRAAAVTASVYHADSTEHGVAGHASAPANAATGIVLPQLSTHR